MKVMNRTLVQIEHLSYKKIFSDFNLTLSSGKITALLGENGAGKTTLMRILAGLNKGIKGLVEINGEILGAKTRGNVSFLDNLQGFSRLQKLSTIAKFYRDFYPDYSVDRARDLMQFMKLDWSMNLGNLSKGMREKFMLVLALSRVTDLYLLDEPFSGIDIIARREIIKSLVRIFDEESTILISSHHAQEMEGIIDDVVIMKDRQVVVHKNLDEIKVDQGYGLEEYYQQVYLEGFK